MTRTARELLAQPHSWTKHANARSKRGFPVSPATPQACRWCLLGAEVATNPVGPPVGAAVDRLAALITEHYPDRIRRNPYVSKSDIVTGFNDHLHTTHTDIVRLLELAYP